MPCIKAFNERKLFKSTPYNNPESKYSKLENILGIKKERTSNKKWKQTIFPIKITKSILIINKKSLIIGSYMDGNIGMELKGDKQHTNKRLANISLEDCKKCLDKFETFINNLYTHNILNIHENLFYILLFLYVSNEPKYNYYISSPNKKKVIIKGNDLKTYETFKKGDSDIIKKILDGNDLEKVIKYIDIHIGCKIETVMSAPNTIIQDNAEDNVE